MPVLQILRPPGGGKPLPYVKKENNLLTLTGARE
jgi:hypothetical protein